MLSRWERSQIQDGIVGKSVTAHVKQRYDYATNRWGAVAPRKGEKGEDMIHGLIGLVIGGILGVLVMGMMCGAGQESRCEECRYNTLKHSVTPSNEKNRTMSKRINYDAIDYKNYNLHDKSEEFLDGIVYMAQRIEEAPSINIESKCGK